MKKKQCFILLKAINSLDDILPVVFELRKANLLPAPIFFAWTKKEHEFLRANIVLMDGIKHINGELRYLYPYKNKAANLLYNTYALKECFYKKLVTINCGIKSKSINSMLWFNKVILGGKRMLSMIINRPAHMQKRHQECADVVADAPPIKISEPDYKRWLGEG